MLCTFGCEPALAGTGEFDLDRAWVIVREDLELSIYPAGGEILLEGTMVARLEHAESSLGPVLAMNTRQDLMHFDDVIVDGAQVELNVSHPDMSGAKLTSIVFDTPKQRGDEVIIRFACHSLTKGSQFVVAEGIALASWVEAWYPILPLAVGTSLGGASKIAGTTTFHLPLGWHAVTNGGLISSEESDGETVEIWSSERALSRSFAAGPYTVIMEEVDGLDVSLYLLSDDLPEPRDNVKSLALAMDAMEARWGPYPYPSYAIAEVPMSAGDFGASSEQGFIMVKPFFLRVPGGNLPLFAHEAAHGWWGNTVGTSSPGELFCSETLAQYGAVIALESVWGVESSTEFLRFSRPGYVSDQCARGYFEILRTGQDKAVQDLQSGGRVDHTISDAKGHWVVHMLRRRVGDEVFFATMRGLISEFTDAQMSLTDFRARFIVAAPDAGLEVFFKQWLEQKGAPMLVHDWEETDSGVNLTVLQLQSGKPYELWLDVQIETGDGSIREERVVLTEQEQSFFVEGFGSVVDVQIDGDHKLLIWGPAYGPAPLPELEHVELRKPDSDLVLACAGEYRVRESNLSLACRAEDGYLMLDLMGKTERLIHTGESRFLSTTGFLIFNVEDGRAQALTFVSNEGSLRRGVRVD
ncbi:MAG: hypothetical protein ACI9F9_001745 [Candidatus Paceibacteria bacterium]|jgi:hypothetical protein